MIGEYILFFFTLMISGAIGGAAMGIVVLLYAGKRFRRMGDEIDAMVQEMRDEIERDRRS